MKEQSASNSALGKMGVMEKTPDLERVREQYLDAETGELVWVSSEAAGERLAAIDARNTPFSAAARG